MAVNEKGEIIRKKNPQPDTSNDNGSDTIAFGICFFGCIITFFTMMALASREENFFVAFIAAVIISFFWPVLLFIYVAMYNDSDRGMENKIIANIYLWGGTITFVILIAIIIVTDADESYFFGAGIASILWPLFLMLLLIGYISGNGIDWIP